MAGCVLGRMCLVAFFCWLRDQFAGGFLSVGRRFFLGCAFGGGIAGEFLLFKGF